MSCSAAVLIAPTNNTPSVIRVKVDGEVNLYMTCEVATDVKGSRLWDVVVYHAKDRGHEKAIQRYNTMVEQPRQNSVPRGSCSCPAGVYHHDKPCRHVNFISVLWANGYL